MDKSEHDTLHKYLDDGQCCGDYNEFDRLWRRCYICSILKECIRITNENERERLIKKY